MLTYDPWASGTPGMGADQVQGQSTKGEEGHWLKSPSDSPLQALSTCPPHQATLAYLSQCLSHRKQGGPLAQGVLTRYEGPGKDNKARRPRQGQKASAQKDHLEGLDSKGWWESPSPLNSCETEASHHSSHTGTHLVSCLPDRLLSVCHNM